MTRHSAYMNDFGTRLPVSLGLNSLLSFHYAWQAMGSSTRRLPQEQAAADAGTVHDG